MKTDVPQLPSPPSTPIQAGAKQGEHPASTRGRNGEKDRDKGEAGKAAHHLSAHLQTPPARPSWLCPRGRPWRPAEQGTGLQVRLLGHMLLLHAAVLCVTGAAVGATGLAPSPNTPVKQGTGVSLPPHHALKAADGPSSGAAATTAQAQKRQSRRSTARCPPSTHRHCLQVADGPSLGVAAGVALGCQNHRQAGVGAPLQLDLQRRGEEGWSAGTASGASAGQLSICTGPCRTTRQRGDQARRPHLLAAALRLERLQQVALQPHLQSGRWRAGDIK